MASEIQGLRTVEIKKVTWGRENDINSVDLRGISMCIFILAVSLFYHSTRKIMCCIQREYHWISLNFTEFPGHRLLYEKSWLAYPVLPRTASTQPHTRCRPNSHSSYCEASLSASHRSFLFPWNRFPGQPCTRENTEAATAYWAFALCWAFL